MTDLFPEKVSQLYLNRELCHDVSPYRAFENGSRRMGMKDVGLVTSYNLVYKHLSNSDVEVNTASVIQVIFGYHL